MLRIVIYAKLLFGGAVYNVETCSMKAITTLILLSVFYIKTRIMKNLFFYFFIFCSPIAAQAQWQQIGQDINGVVKGFIKTSNGLLLSGGTGGVHISEDNGDTWNVSNNGINSDDQLINCLERSADRIFVGTETNIYYSDDDGETWVISNQVGYGVAGLAAFGANNLFAVTKGYGVLMSANNGISWATFNIGLPTDSILSIVAIGDVLFVGTYRHGIYRSYDNGTSWLEANDDMSDTVSVLSLETDGFKLFAGTDGDGLLISSDSGGTWIRLPT